MKKIEKILIAILIIVPVFAYVNYLLFLTKLDTYLPKVLDKFGIICMFLSGYFIPLQILAIIYLIINKKKYVLALLFGLIIISTLMLLNKLQKEF